MKRTTLLVSAAAVAVSIAAGSAAAIGSRSAPVAKVDPRLAPQLVQIATAVPNARATRAFTGAVSARVQSNLGFRVSGKVVERLVDVGQTVRASAPLMKLDQTDLGLARTAKQEAVLAARAAAQQAAADEDRYRRLLASGWSTQQKYEQAKALRDSTAAQLAAAESQAEVASNEAVYSTLLADADGVVVETLAEPGQVVSAGQTVVRLAHAGSREAVVFLPETVRPAIGSEAEARTYGVTLAPSRAILRQLSEAADPATRTYEARYVLEGSAARAPLGATVTVWIAKDESSATVQVPLGAIDDNGVGSGVFVLDDSSTVTRRSVQISEIGEEIALVTGIAPGERIVALGAHLLHDGQRVVASEPKVLVR
jgi:RND family efflux transporter MFP subunit